MIQVSHLSQTVGSDKHKVLNDISVEFGTNEIIGIVGPSGSGKSTLLRCLALRNSWSKGSMTQDGKPIVHNGGKGKRKYRSKFAYLEQNPELFLEKTAVKNVLIGQAGQTPLIRRITGRVASDNYMGAMDELEKFGLLDKAQLKVGNLSGGERQRVAICRALVHGAELLAADEPVVGLDPHSADRVMDTLKSLCKEQGMTVITVLPLELAERYCTRIWGINEGRLLFDVKGRRLNASEREQI